MPDFSKTNPDLHLQYINGHYAYALKLGIITNGLGVPRFIKFFDNDFKKKHPQIVSKKSYNHNLDKEISDAKSLIPVLSDFFELHPTFSFNTFIADSAFDSYEIFSMLKEKFNFSRICIPLNSRNSKYDKPNFNENGIPLCPISNEPFKYQGICREKGRSDRIKWFCPKAKPYNKGIFSCPIGNRCTQSEYGRVIYTSVDKNFRFYPDIVRGTTHWDNLYNQRIHIERSINTIKNTFNIDERKSFNSATAKADVYFAAILQLIIVIIADKLKVPQYYKSIKK